MKKMDNADAQLMALRGMTQLTGILHDAQVFQLKMWPLVAVPHSVSSEFECDMDKRTIEFRIVTKGRAPKNLQERLQGLDRSVKFLLGDEWSVVVKGNNKFLYRGGPKVLPVKETNVGRNPEVSNPRPSE